MKTILGIHHITAIASDPQENIEFYTGVLGLRLVKLTVNFDDPSSYHLYYGDGGGNPGTILTFFSWPGARRGRHGSNQVTATTFAIPPDSIPFWLDRFGTHGIDFQSPIERFGQKVLPFSDDDGMRLELIETEGLDPSHLWAESDIPAASAIHGFHSATLTETGYERTASLLTQTMGFRLVAQEQNRFRYEIGQGGASRTADVVCAPGAPEGRVAVGTVHHIAWRTPDDAAQTEWLAEVTQLGYNVSPVMDRTYFHSIYFREPGGILFEIATDPPGFTVDEPPAELGTHLKLPPWFESHRASIEGALQPLEFQRKGALS